MECWTINCKAIWISDNSLRVEQAWKFQVDCTDSSSQLEFSSQHQGFRPKTFRFDQVRHTIIELVWTSNLKKFFSVHRNCLMQTLQHTMHIQEFVKSKGIDIKFHGRNKNEASHYCGQCEVRIEREMYT